MHPHEPRFRRTRAGLKPAWRRWAVATGLALIVAAVTVWLMVG